MSRETYNQSIFDDLSIDTLIENNEYIKQCKSNNKKNENSLSYLINRKLSQSDCIKLGNGLEKLLCDIILKNTSLKNIKGKNSKGKKERDHLFCNEEHKIIYYAELKSNINLDTEKLNATYKKCLYIVNELQLQYPEYKIEWCLLACRYISKQEIPNYLKNKYMEIKENLFGINDYLELVGINHLFTKDSYSMFLNKIADKMFM